MERTARQSGQAARPGPAAESVLLAGPADSRGAGLRADRGLAANACAVSYHQPRRAGRSPRRRGPGRRCPDRAAGPPLPGRGSPRERSAARAGRMLRWRGIRSARISRTRPGIRPGGRITRRLIVRIMRRLIVDCAAALDPAGDGPVTAAGGQHLTCGTAVARLPGDNYPARSPRVPGLALGRVSPPVRQPRVVHSYTRTCIR
jgi:hypothetical protein